jgi:fatty-acyl-CoA synthase
MNGSTEHLEAPVATFNLADLFEMVTDAVPDDRRALVTAGRRLTYAALEERANRLAHHLVGAGVRSGEHVGLQMTNGTEYVEGMLACFKIRAVPVNVNYRYVADELGHLFADADLVALIVHRSFASRIETVLPPTLNHVLVVEDGTDGPTPPGAVSYEDALATSSPARDFEARSGDDRYIAYTGGTTGLPKGVLWRQEDIFFAGMGGGDPLRAGNVVKRPEELLDRIYTPGLVALATPPFMHVSAHWLVFQILFAAGTIVCTPGGSFDPAEIWRLVAEEHVNILVIVGDAMARPLATSLESNTFDTSALMVIGSGGAVLSPGTKDRLARLLPNVLIVDGFGSSETGTLGGQATQAATGPSAGALRMPPREDVAVLDDNLHPVTPGTVGRLARRGHVPLGYHKDPVKTDATILERDGVRWVLPGDMATVEDDGTIVLLGRGSGSINTGGEKVFPEEVETALKEHPAVDDAVVVGVPDERWGERVVAVVKPAAGATPALGELQAFCRERLAGYKVPKDLVLVEEVQRQPSAKPDYRWAREQAVEALGGGGQA